MKTTTTKGSETTTTKTSKVSKCLCGCGVEVTRTFAQGHDARIHSLVNRITRGEASLRELSRSERMFDYLRGAKWVTRDHKKAIGLDAPAARKASKAKAEKAPKADKVLKAEKVAS